VELTGNGKMLCNADYHDIHSSAHVMG